MNKKILATAIATAVAAPAAFADATMYGVMHVTVDSVDNETGGASTQDNYTVSSRNSRVGIKGSEDLGNGLKAIYQFETVITADGGTGQTVGNGFGSQRNTFVGLAGGFGTFLVGRHDTPAKIALYGSGNELLGDSIIDFNTGVNGVFSEVRANNAIAYVSPNFSGFTFAAAIVPGEESGVATAAATGTSTITTTGGTIKVVTTTPAAANDANGLADHVSLGLMYAGGGLKASVSYEELDGQAGGAAGSTVDREVIQVGGSYTFGAFQVGAQYETADNWGWANGAERDAWGLFGKATFGNNAVMLNYTDAEAENAAGAKTEDTDGWGVAAEHMFSKRTKVYAAYATEDNDVGNVDNSAFSLGMIHSF